MYVPVTGVAIVVYKLDAHTLSALHRRVLIIIKVHYRRVCDHLKFQSGRLSVANCVKTSPHNYRNILLAFKYKIPLTTLHASPHEIRMCHIGTVRVNTNPITRKV